MGRTRTIDSNKNRLYKSPMFNLHLSLLISNLPRVCDPHSPLLHQRHRRNITPPRPNHIIRRRGNDDECKNHNTPIPIPRRRRGRDGEKTHHKSHGQESQRGIVDGCAEPAQRPAAGQERFVAEGLEADAADGDHVGGDESGVGEGDDGVEGGDEEGEEEGDEDGVEGDVHAWADLNLHFFGRKGCGGEKGAALHVR